jgi:hypothetical protein
MEEHMVLCEHAGLPMAEKKKNSLPKVQTLFPEELIIKFKMEALRRGIPVKTLYDEAISEWLRDREKVIEQTGRLPVYQVPADTMPIPGVKKAEPGKKSILNAEVTPARAKQIEKIATVDNRSNSAVLYTSLMHYMDKKNLWD